jgi:flagellar basal body-associated protein FliL
MRLLSMIILLVVIIIIIIITVTNTYESFYFRRRRRGSGDRRRRGSGDRRRRGSGDRRRRRRRRRRGRSSEAKSPDYTPPADTPPVNISYTSAQQQIADYIGPSYSYPKHIKNPDQLGIKSSSSPDAIIKDVEGLAKYIGYLVFGPGLGNNFWIKSGTCDKNTSTPECQGKDRWVYVKTIPDGSNPCLKDIGISIPGDQMVGLIPGIMEDMLDIATIPLEMIGSFLGSNGDSFKCSMTSKKTGPSNNLKNESKCAPPDKAVTCIPETFETEEQDIEPPSSKKFKLVWLFIVIVIIFLILGLTSFFKR